MQHLDQQHRRAIELYQAGKLPQAAGILYNILMVNQAHVDARNDLGAILFYLGRRKSALVHIQEAYRLAPHRTDISDNLRQVRQQLGLAS